MRQIEHHRESTARQYQLAERAVELGWHREDVTVLDEDLGISGSGLAERTGFAHLTAEVALGRVGMVLGLEVSRLARNNADWYRLLDLCGVTDTLIGDADGIYHPGLFNDRLVLGLKGTMSEAELHVLRARLNGGIRNKAARGELRRGLPVGFIWGEQDGEVLLHPDQAVTSAIRAVFARFTEMGSVRRVWLWFCSEGLRWPLQSHNVQEVQWVTPTYTKIRQVLTNPVYAGVYAYGKTRHERYIDENGRLRKRVRKRARAEWPVFLHDHHPGFIDWETFEANQRRIGENIRPGPHRSRGAVREGSALLQGIAICGHCGRRLRVHYRGRHSAPGYHCAGKNIVNGRGEYCLSVGGCQIDAKTATELPFNANRVSSLRTHWNVPCFQPASQPQQGECVTIERAAQTLGVAASTLHRWLNEGFIAGEQVTPGAPWRIRLTAELRARFVEQAPEGYLPMIDATRILGVSRQTILQRVKRGELEAVHVHCGRRKGLRIKIPTTVPDLFNTHSTEGV